MKKLWGIACLLLLFGCTDVNKEPSEMENEPDKSQEESSKYQEEFEIALNLIEQNKLYEAMDILTVLKEEISSKDDVNLLNKVETELANLHKTIATDQRENKQLADIFVQLFKSYGVIPSNHKYHDRKGDLYVGIVYADLIDFNNDGKKELYTLFKSSTYMKYGPSHRANNGYIEEIWGIGENEEQKLLWNQFYPYDSTEISGLSISFNLLENGTTVLKHLTNNSSFSNTKFYALRDHSFSMIDEFNIKTGEHNEYQLNGESVDLVTFNEKLSQYNNSSETDIINSDSGTIEFGISLANPFNQIEVVMEELSSTIHPTPNNEQNIIEDKSIFATTKEYRNFGHIDVRDSSTYTTMIDSLILDGIVKSDAEQFEPFGAGYKEETIINAVKTYFGVTIVPTNLGLPSELSGHYWLHYVNNGFYLPASDFYRQQEIATPETITQLADDLFYVKTNNFKFNLMEHFMNTEIQLNINEYLDVPMNDWPEHTQPFLTKDLPVYLILKKMDNRYQLLYKSYLNLTDEELVEFANQ